MTKHTGISRNYSEYNPPQLTTPIGMSYKLKEKNIQITI